MELADLRIALDKLGRAMGRPVYWPGQGDLASFRAGALSYSQAPEGYKLIEITGGNGWGEREIFGGERHSLREMVDRVYFALAVLDVKAGYAANL